MTNQSIYRYRIEYAKTAPMRFTSHLDTLHTWERTFRRAKIPLAYTQGFNPRPRIHLSPALPLGFTSECELMDIWVTEEIVAELIMERVHSTLPPGLEIHSVHQLPDQAPKLHEEIIAAEYHVHLDPTPSLDHLSRQIDQLLRAPEIIRVRRGREYDLRPMIRSLDVHLSEKETCLRMCLAAMEGATGRPEEVLHALQMDSARSWIQRKRFIFVDKT